MRLTDDQLTILHDALAFYTEHIGGPDEELAAKEEKRVQVVIDKVHAEQDRRANPKSRQRYSKWDRLKDDKHLLVKLFKGEMTQERAK